MGENSKRTTRDRSPPIITHAKDMGMTAVEHKRYHFDGNDVVRFMNENPTAAGHLRRIIVNTIQTDPRFQITNEKYLALDTTRTEVILPSVKTNLPTCRRRVESIAIAHLGQSPR